MTTPTTVNQEKQDLSKLDLEPAKLDFLSVKTQIVLAAILSSILVFATYWSTLRIGFLHDDWLHLDYVARAVLNGDSRDFLANFYSNWGGSDLMSSYRPFVSLSLLFDFLAYKTNALGYHLTNILLTCGCCLFVALIASELSGSFGNRMRATTAIWAALLFAAYPLHVESVAWIIGRVDLLCTLFYLAALYYFLRLKLIEEPAYILLSAGCFLLSLLSKEMAVTLPAVATVFAFLIPGSADNRVGRKVWEKFIRVPSRLELKTLGILWLTLILFAILRALLLGNAIGGYGSTDISSILTVFANKAAILKILIPVNEEILPPSKNIITIGFATYIAAAVFAGLRCLATPSLIRYFLTFFLFAAIALLPTFQVWNIANNLCGSRLFFLSSAALALALAFAFVPNEDSIDKTSTKLVATAGVGFLAFTLLVFCALTHKNLTVFLGAAEMIEKLGKEVRQLHRQNPQGHFVLLNVPSDYHGAPVLTRPQYFKIMISPPFGTAGEAKSFETAEMKLPYEHSNYSCDLLRDLTKTAEAKRPYVWSEADLKLRPLNFTSGENSFKCSFGDANECMYFPADVKKSDGRNWHVFYKHEPQAVTLQTGLRLYPGDIALKATKSIPQVNPLNTPLVKIAMTVDANQPVARLLHLIRFTWRQEAGVLSNDKAAALLRTGDTTFECPLADNKEWLLGGPVDAVGVSLLGCPYYTDLHSIEGIPREECTPDLSRVSGKGQFQVDASKVRDASALLVLISKPGNSFDTAIDVNALRNYRNLQVPPQQKKLASPDSSITGRVQHWIFFEQSEGAFNIPPEVYNDGKSHEIVVIALDKNGHMIGLPSRVLKVN